MKSFKEFSAKEEKKECAQEEVKQKAQDLTDQIAAAYNGKSDTEIWKNILKEAERGRREGTLSDRDIDNFYQMFSPMVSPSQRKQLQAIVEKLKKM